MRVLVTGYAGFIGSNLCELLAKQDYSIVGVDSFNDFYDPKIKFKNIVPLRGKILRCDMDINSTDLGEVLSNYRPDCVVHLAGAAGVRQSMEKPLRYIWDNCSGTVNLLQQMVKCGIKNLVFASSSSVYGDNIGRTPSLECDACCPKSVYASSKLFCENIIKDYVHSFGLNAICCRFFTVYGRNQRPDLAIAKFTNLLMSGRKIQIYGGLESERDYTHVSDVCRGISKSMDYLYDNPKATFEIFNLCSSRPKSLGSVVECLCKKIGVDFRSSLEYVGMPKEDVNITYGCNDKAKHLLIWSPLMNFDDGIGDYLKSLVEDVVCKK